MDTNEKDGIFNQAAGPKSYISLFDVIGTWAKEDLSPFLTKLNAPTYHQEFMAMMDTYTNGLESMTERMQVDALSESSAHKIYVDTSTDFTFKDISKKMVVTADNPHLVNAVNEICDAADKVESGKGKQFRGAFLKHCQAAKKYNVEATDGSIGNFSTVFRAKNPFRVQDLTRKPGA